MICKQCGADNPAGATVCGACGKPLELMPTEPFQDDISFEPAKKSHGKLVRRIVLIVLAVLVAAAGVVFHREIAEFFIRTFSSPAAYYQHVEKNAIRSHAETAGKLYEAYFGADGGKTARGSNATLTMKPALEDGDAPINMTMEIAATAQANEAATDMALFVNDHEIMTADTYINTDDDLTAVRIPVLSDSYVRMEQDDLYDGPMSGYILIISAFREAGLTRSEVESLTEKCLTALVEDLDDVTRARGTLTAGDVSQACTVLTVTITPEDLAVAQKKLASVLDSDSAGRRLMQAFADVTREDPDALLEAIFTPEGDGGMTMTVSVGADGRVAGRALETDGASSFRLAIPVNKFKLAAGYAMELCIDDENTFRMDGAVRKTEASFAAEATLEGKELDLFTLELSDLKTQKGSTSGSFALQFDRDLGKLTGSAMTGVIFRRMDMSGIFDIAGANQQYDVDVNYSGDPILTLAFDVKNAEPQPITPVRETVSKSEWLRSIDPEAATDRIRAALEEAGLDAGVLDVLTMQFGL